MFSELFFSTTPGSIALIILCMIFQNMFPAIFKENGENALIKIEVDTSDSKQVLWLIIGIAIVLFTPIINITFALIYCGWVLYSVYKYLQRDINQRR